jgi:hypothetical protein
MRLPPFLISSLILAMILGCSKSKDQDDRPIDLGVPPPITDTLEMITGSYWGHYYVSGYFGPNPVSYDVDTLLLVSEDNTMDRGVNVEGFAQHIFVDHDLTMTSAQPYPFFGGSFTLGDTVKMVIHKEEHSPGMFLSYGFYAHKLP